MDKYQEKYQKTVKIVDYIFNVLFVINIIFMLIAYSQWDTKFLILCWVWAILFNQD